MKAWITAKYRQLLILLGLRIEHEWLLLRAIERKLGTEQAQSLYALSILLDLEHNGLPTKKRIQKIVKATTYRRT